MALYRPVHVTFWQDPRVIEEMTPEDKLFYLYLITNPKTTQIGIYQITKKQIAFEIGYSIESVNALMDRFENHHKIIKYNPETRELAIKNWGKYNFPRAGTPIENCVKNELSKIKDMELVKLVGSKVENKKIREIFDNYINIECDELRDVNRDGGNNNNNNNNNNNHNNVTQKELMVVIEEIRKYFNLEENDIKRVANTFIATRKDINYLIEKLEYVKGNPNTRDVMGLLISALKNDYKASVNQNNTNYSIPSNKFANFDQTFMQYSEDELEAIIEKAQREKFN